jgi:hypothetical protein
MSALLGTIYILACTKYKITPHSDADTTHVGYSDTMKPTYNAMTVCRCNFYS